MMTLRDLRMFGVEQLPVLTHIRAPLPLFCLGTGQVKGMDTDTDRFSTSLKRTVNTLKLYVLF